MRTQARISIFIEAVAGDFWKEIEKQAGIRADPALFLYRESEPTVTE